MTPRKPAPPATPEINDVEELLDVAGDSTHRVWFYRERGAGNWPYIGQVDPATLRATGIREYSRTRWGGGQFRAKLRHVNGTWSFSRTFTVEGEPIQAKHDDAKPADAPAAAGGPPAWMEKILLPIGVTFATALGGYLAKKLLETPAPDPLMLELVKGLRGGSAAAASMTPFDFARAIAEAEQRGETRGREFGELRAHVETTGTGKIDGVVGAIDRGLPQLVSVLNRKFDLDAQRMQYNPPASSPGAAPAADEVQHESMTALPSSEPANTDDLVALLLSVPPMARRFLLTAAEHDEPAQTYADLVLGKLDDVTYARMPALLARADFVDVFVTTYPAFADYRAWVEQLAEEMRASLEAATLDDDETSAAPPEAAKHAAP